MLFSNLIGSALVIVFFDQSTIVGDRLPWLTPSIHQLIILIFANVLWILQVLLYQHGCGLICRKIANCWPTVIR
ncbi:MAG: hypothetical protein U5J63_04850 [Fodinibius sp.]|nr:hypothetical protein [Fodinibius sp.]